MRALHSAQYVAAGLLLSGCCHRPINSCGAERCCGQASPRVSEMNTDVVKITLRTQDDFNLVKIAENSQENRELM